MIGQKALKVTIPCQFLLILLNVVSIPCQEMSECNDFEEEVASLALLKMKHFQGSWS